MKLIEIIRILVILGLTVGSTSTEHIGIIELNDKWAEKEGLEGTKRLSYLWNNQLNDSGFKIKVYVQSPTKVLILAQSEEELTKLRKIILTHAPAVDVYV